ncbi:type II toxin-antitoxin system Phd/YefM family antitoxin [Pseudomonas sp. BF-R-19]|uniref:type II toxin-antitoxin system Phd/YefM family antitoxin n=1 Tax=Pseudomonas sp. BF-R-19 TaxID=2832397 RepID=UPI001CBFC7DF|nr:type II toxin-antitoxin system Phd/YefM family antitoxin [Pseudomonas sp. BF-R-19]
MTAWQLMHWTATRATSNFDELLEKLITTRKPIFIDGERRSAVLISIDEWNAIQDELRPRVQSDL